MPPCLWLNPYAVQEPNRRLRPDADSERHAKILRGVSGVQVAGVVMIAGHITLTFSDGGGAEGDRTPDLCNAIAALSQLSYGPVPITHQELR